MAVKKSSAVIRWMMFLSLIFEYPKEGSAQPVPKISGEHQPRSLQILVLEGSRAESHPGSLGIAPVVELRDDVDRPVEGAIITFNLPLTGAGGIFQSGERSFTAKTNAQGQAMPTQFTMGSALGPFHIRVSAKYRDLTA